MSLFTFFLNDLSIGMSGGELKSPTISVGGSVSDLICHSSFINLGALVVGILMLRVAMSSWWISL